MRDNKGMNASDMLFFHPCHFFSFQICYVPSPSTTLEWKYRELNKQVRSTWLELDVIFRISLSVAVYWKFVRMWPQLFMVGAGAVAARFALRTARRLNLASKIPVMPDLTALRGLDGFASGTMSKNEAIKILNIQPHMALDIEKVRDVHRKLLLANHPDRGGSTLVSTKINEAREVLFGKKK